MSLDQQTAVKRAKLIRQDSLSYNYHIILETDLYHGLAELTFYLEALPQTDLLLDYSGDAV
jgi:aminopeptidase N